jgi:hypothetical protein
MTDHPGEPSSETPALASTSEPLASVEDQAWISGLLAALATADQQIPATIAANLEQALDSEQRRRTAVREAPEPESASASGTRWNPRWLAIAAAAVVVIGGVSLYQQTSASNGPSTGSADSSYVAASAPESATSAQLASETRVVNAPNAMVRQATVAAQVTTILASSQPINTTLNSPAPSMTKAEASTSVGAASSGSGDVSAGGSTGGGTADGSTTTNSQSADRGAWADCLATITGTAGNPPTAVITGISYFVASSDPLAAQPADLLVRPVIGDITHLDVWIVEPGCSASRTQLLDHRVIPAAG